MLSKISKNSSMVIWRSIFIFGSLFLISTSCWSVDWYDNELVERDGLTYKKFSETPFTGEVKGQWKEPPPSTKL